MKAADVNLDRLVAGCLSCDSCPDCDAPAKAADVNLDRLVARRCLACDPVFSFADPTAASLVFYARFEIPANRPG